MKTTPPKSIPSGGVLMMKIEGLGWNLVTVTRSWLMSRVIFTLITPFSEASCIIAVDRSSLRRPRPSGERFRRSITAISQRKFVLICSDASVKGTELEPNPARRINKCPFQQPLFIHSSLVTAFSQVHIRSFVHPRNTGCEVGMHLEWDTSPLLTTATTLSFNLSHVCMLGNSFQLS